MPMRDGCVWNPEKCRECGGKCCQLYRGWKDLLDQTHKVISARLSRHFEFQEAEIPEPRFDISRAFLPMEYEYRKELSAAGVDISFCEYNHPENGCIVLWENRPPVCKAYYCDSWEKTYEIVSDAVSPNSRLFEPEQCWKDPYVLRCGGDCGENCPSDEED